MKAVSVLEHFSDHGSIHQKIKKNTTSVRSYPNSAGDGDCSSLNRLIISHLWNRYQNEHKVPRRPSSGYPRVTTCENRYLCLQSGRYRTNSTRQFPSRVEMSSGIKISLDKLYLQKSSVLQTTVSKFHLRKHFHKHIWI
ncbi:hypothetical protein TNCV_4533571 [Trichonephila clavipes]|nr:hypothetical protein TNCV_4533571 [Trichonephila clavipes]